MKVTSKHHEDEMSDDEFVALAVQGLVSWAPSPRERAFMRLYAAARNAALEEAAKVADYGMLVPPDGGSPTQDEIDVAERIAAAIRALKT